MRRHAKARRDSDANPPTAAWVDVTISRSDYTGAMKLSWDPGLGRRELAPVDIID